MTVSRLQILRNNLKVNPDYLSHLFKEQEHITIKRYILQEKIRKPMEEEADVQVLLEKEKSEVERERN